LSKYHAKGYKLLASAFGATSAPTTNRDNAVTVGTLFQIVVSFIKYFFKQQN